MTKFRSKPKDIKAEQFFPDSPIWPKGVLAWPGEYVVFNELHSMYITIKPGDWVRIDNKNDIYPIDQSYMKEHYEVIL